MAKQRMVNTRFWIDDYISNLDPTEKLLFLYFLTNPMTDICGVYEIPLKIVAVETGIDEFMVKKILVRFEKDNKMIYEHGWIAIKNFQKHQAKNPKIVKGMENGLLEAPKELIDRLSIAYEGLSHSNSNIKSNFNININTAKIADSGVFSLENEVKKLEDNPRRDMNIIALYFEHKKPNLTSYDQFQTALKRHLRAAKELVPFTDNQILEAIPKAKKITDGWTIETLVKCCIK